MNFHPGTVPKQFYHFPSNETVQTVQAVHIKRVFEAVHNIQAIQAVPVT
jgi:hypothetical protein